MALLPAPTILSTPVAPPVPTSPAPLASLASLALPALPTVFSPLAALANPAPVTPLAYPVPLEHTTSLVPPTQPKLPIASQSQFIKDVIKKETKRKITLELGAQLQLQKRALDTGEQILFPDLTNIPIESFIPLPENTQRSLTPMERFCVPDLTDDAGSVYARIQWNTENDPPLSLNARQQHVDHLNLRFYEGFHRGVPVEAQKPQLENERKKHRQIQTGSFDVQ